MRAFTSGPQTGSGGWGAGGTVSGPSLPQALAATSAISAASPAPAARSVTQAVAGRRLT